MKFFAVDNLENAFPIQPVLREFIQVVHKYYHQTKDSQPSRRTNTFIELFDHYDQLNPETKVSAGLRAIALQEQEDLKNGVISALLNKVIYNEITPNPLDFHRTEFHEHTYDIHLVFANTEQYIYQLTITPSPLPLEADPEPLNDAKFAYDLKELKTVFLNANEGLIIPPNIPHFAGFRHELTKEQSLFKCVVKLDARYAQSMLIA